MANGGNNTLDYRGPAREEDLEATAINTALAGKGLDQIESAVRSASLTVRAFHKAMASEYSRERLSGRCARCGGATGSVAAITRRLIARRRFVRSLSPELHKRGGFQTFHSLCDTCVARTRRLERAAKLLALSGFLIWAGIIAFRVSRAGTHHLGPVDVGPLESFLLGPVPFFAGAGCLLAANGCWRMRVPRPVRRRIRAQPQRLMRVS